MVVFTDIQAMGYERVSNQLWQERKILELLVFKLEEEHLILVSGRHAWLKHATTEVEHVVDALRAAEAVRAEAVAELGEELGIGSTPSILDIAEAAGDPWSEIFIQHQEELLKILNKINSIATANREILAQNIVATTDALSLLGESPVAAYDSNAQAVSEAPSARLMNASL